MILLDFGSGEKLHISPMGVNLLSISVASSILSLVGLLHFSEKSLGKYRLGEVLINGHVNLDGPGHARDILSSSCATLTLMTTFSVNLVISIILCLKNIFFQSCTPLRSGKCLSALLITSFTSFLFCLTLCCFWAFYFVLIIVDSQLTWPKLYSFSKGTFLPLVVPPTVFQSGMWSTWLFVLCFLKMFQALARDRLERLNACPSATPWTYFRVYSALILVFSLDLLWIAFCLTIYREARSPIHLLLFFEPCSIAFETLQAIVIHGFQLLEIWLHHSMSGIIKCRFSKIFGITLGGSLGECKGVLIRDLGFFLDIMAMIMALAHYVHIWWLHGMAFHIVDAILFLNIRALLSALVKRAKGFIKLQIALRTLHGALPDATSEELHIYNDECAICREPMAKAKKLPCKHLFHLACLRSWLDQGLSESYSCPTCRKPLLTNRSAGETSAQMADVSTDEELARQISAGLDRQNLTGHGEFPIQSHNAETNDWGRRGVDTRWSGMDGGGPSGFSRVHMVMRQLAAMGETYAQTALEDTAWSLFPPPNPSQASTSTSNAYTSAVSAQHPRVGGLHLRSTSNGSPSPNIFSMAATVREVLPHVHEDIILQDLRRTNSVVVTVNNLLQM